MSAIGCQKRKIAKTHRERLAVINAAQARGDKSGEYLKHATHLRAFQRWINLGMPDDMPRVLTQKAEHREAGRLARRDAHYRRYEIGRQYTTGKSALRRQRRNRING